MYNHPIGSIYHLYTTYSPCQLGDYMLPTTYQGNQETPLIIGQFHHSSPPHASLHPGRGEKNTFSACVRRSGSQSLGSVDLKQRMVPWHWREAAKCLIWLVVWNILYFHPYLGKIPILTNTSQMGWNHQLVICGWYCWWFRNPKQPTWDVRSPCKSWHKKPYQLVS